MARKRRNPGRQPACARRQTPAEIEAGVRGELRSILRRLARLRQPFDEFQAEASIPAGQTGHRVVAAASHEAVQEEILALAGSVWHLKDRLNTWANANRFPCDPSIKAFAEANGALLVCADLINAKKHGGMNNYSGFSPYLSGIKLNTSKSGVLGIRFDGGLQETDLLVTHTDPVPWRVEILTGDGKGTLGNAVDVIEAAFRAWLPLITDLGFLSAADPETSRLGQVLASSVVATGGAPGAATSDD
jgi:HAMP domain-containing protein